MDTLAAFFHWLTSLTFHNWWDFATSTIAIASAAYTLLPPWEQFNQWPRFQSKYQFCLIFLKAVAINGRSAMSKVYGNDITATSNQSGTDPKILGKP
jgi:hypothetical protein